MINFLYCFWTRCFCILFVSCFSVLMPSLRAQTIRYVMPMSNGTADGSSWANASNDLQAMINNSAIDDQVWIAAGTYQPTQDAFGNSTPTNDRDKTSHERSE